MSATIIVPNTAAAGAAATNGKDRIIKNYTPFTNCISEINNTQIDNAKDIEIVLPMYNLKPGGLWHYYRDKLFLSNGAIVTGQGDVYTTGCLLDYNYFNNYHKMIAIDLSKQGALDTDPKAIQQIIFTEHLDWDGSKTIFFTIEEAKEAILEFSQETVKVL